MDPYRRLGDLADRLGIKQWSGEDVGLVVELDDGRQYDPYAIMEAFLGYLDAALTKLKQP